MRLPKGAFFPCGFLTFLSLNKDVKKIKIIWKVLPFDLWGVSAHDNFKVILPTTKEFQSCFLLESLVIFLLKGASPVDQPPYKTQTPPTTKQGSMPCLLLLYCLALLLTYPLQLMHNWLYPNTTELSGS